MFVGHPVTSGGIATEAVEIREHESHFSLLSPSRLHHCIKSDTDLSIYNRTRTGQFIRRPYPRRNHHLPTDNGPTTSVSRVVKAGGFLARPAGIHPLSGVITWFLSGLTANPPGESKPLDCKQSGRPPLSPRCSKQSSNAWKTHRHNPRLGLRSGDVISALQYLGD
jgi:hypothetical protein